MFQVQIYLQKLSQFEKTGLVNLLTKTNNNKAVMKEKIKYIRNKKRVHGAIIMKMH